MKSRRKARELALQVLYAVEMQDACDYHALIGYLVQENALTGEVQKYSRDLVEKCLEVRGEIDAMLMSKSANWELKRMASIDRNLLRCAITELLHFPGVPSKVIIDEAVEIAKLYGNDDSPKFVNGILDSIYKDFVKSQSKRGR